MEREQPQGKIRTILEMAVSLPLLAFSVDVRHEIGEAHEWTCTWKGCDDGFGEPKSFQNGWMVFASHVKTHDKSDPRYNEASSGTIYCIEHEIANHQRLLHIAQQHSDYEGIVFNKRALAKLNQVDWRTIDYRKNPRKYKR